MRHLLEKSKVRNPIYTKAFEVNVIVIHFSQEHYHTDQSWSHWLLWNLKPVWFCQNWEKSGLWL